MAGNENHGEGYHLDSRHDPDEALRKIRTTGSLSISPELFEKIYLSPQNKVAGELRKTVGNPTPFALVGFLLSLTPVSCALMGWRGAADGFATLGAYVAFGGVLMILGSVGEWILGNTFPCVVFGSFGAFWITFAITLMPYTGAFGDFSTNPNNPALGLATVGFTSSWAFFLVFMGVMCFVYSICALRTNLVLFLILFFLIPTFGCLAGAYWFMIDDPTKSAACLVAGGACAFVVCMLGWYIFSAILLAAVDFPLSLPVFDLSHIIKGASDKKKAAEDDV